MARESFIICDGCGHRRPIDKAKDFAFQVVSVTVGDWSETFDLCQSCHSRLTNEADPRKWPRVNAVTATGD